MKGKIVVETGRFTNGAIIRTEPKPKPEITNSELRNVEDRLKKIERSISHMNEDIMYTNNPPRPY